MLTEGVVWKDCAVVFSIPTAIAVSLFALTSVFGTPEVPEKVRVVEKTVTVEKIVEVLVPPPVVKPEEIGRAHV